MAPEYGATMGFFPVDDRDRSSTARAPAAPRSRSTRSRTTSRRRACSACRSAGEIDYTQDRSSSISSTVTPVARRPEASAGPHRARRSSKRRSPSCSASRSQRTASRRRRTSCAALHDVRWSRRASARSATRSSAAGTRACRATYVEMVEQPSDARPRQRRRRRSAIDDRQRRRADRRDHLVHEHLEPERDARRRPAREEGGRDGLTVEPHVKTSLAPGSRVVTEYLTQDRPAAVPRASSASTSSATAARPASATPAR